MQRAFIITSIIQGHIWNIQVNRFYKFAVHIAQSYTFIINKYQNPSNNEFQCFEMCTKFTAYLQFCCFRMQYSGICNNDVCFPSSYT